MEGYAANKYYSLETIETKENHDVVSAKYRI